MPGDPCDDWNPKLLRQVIGSRPRELPSHHVLDDPHQVRTTIEGRAHRAPHRVARFRSRDCDRQHLRRIAEDVAELEVALHTGRKVEQKDVERAPSDVAKKLTKRRRLHRPSPPEALCSWPLELERRTVLGEQRIEMQRTPSGLKAGMTASSG